jgi:hypothetical protein
MIIVFEKAKAHPVCLEKRYLVNDDVVTPSLMRDAKLTPLIRLVRAARRISRWKIMANGH